MSKGSASDLDILRLDTLLLAERAVSVLIAVRLNFEIKQAGRDVSGQEAVFHVSRPSTMENIMELLARMENVCLIKPC